MSCVGDSGVCMRRMKSVCLYACVCVCVCVCDCRSEHLEGAWHSSLLVFSQISLRKKLWW